MGSSRPPSRFFLFAFLFVFGCSLCPCSRGEPFPHEAYAYHESGTPCYDNLGKPKRCIPEFGNAAFGLDVEATNTCGENGDSHYCIQTSAMAHGSCGYVCRSGDHPPTFLTDLNKPRNQTWWQSETMEHSIQYPNMVNLTLHLKKAYDITYVRVLFYSPRPESFAIYKRTREDGPWIPFQFYSGTCRDTYGLDDRKYALQHEITSAICTSEFSEISPLTGGNIAFSTLEARQFAAYNFNNDPNLQEWVTATDIRIVLNRMNTFGDEVFGDVNTVHRSYFYAITDIAVGARCKCNGHASECIPIPVTSEGRTRKVCRCEHNTAGPDCEQCAAFYQDAPWRRATDEDAYECKPCNCNGYSSRCYFDVALYKRTGHGGHCLDCTANRDGPNCERCRDNYYQLDDRTCVPCNCDKIGSWSLQCNSEGKCQCKPGVVGDKCDRCGEVFYDFGPAGCKECKCLEAGSHNNKPSCHQDTGLCSCKHNVEGKNCTRCKLGYFNLEADNEFGCTPCFCYGHSSDCTPLGGYAQVSIESVFSRTNEKWTGSEKEGGYSQVKFNPTTQLISVTAHGKKPVYFVAPERYLGDQRASYNKLLEFKLRIGEGSGAVGVDDIVLQGAGLTVSQTIHGQDNPLPSTTSGVYKFKLHEHPNYGWKPSLSAKEFMSLLSNLTAIKIRGTYNPKGMGFLDDVRLTTVRSGAVGRQAWIERCLCPKGYVGQFCESCAPGFRHQNPSAGPFSPCVPCDCNGHSDICDSITGHCICHHNTTGENCDRCSSGYYGNALEGTPDDCKPCPCPNKGACMQLSGTVLCINCPTGYSGARCDSCSDGYYVESIVEASKVCKPCDCNTNVDPNAVGNCDKETGECLKCIYNTGGSQCDQCLPGYYGDALAKDKGDCKPCRCDPAGTELSVHGLTLCNQLTGQCQCKHHVTGINCDQCLPGYYNITSREGCQPCNCNLVGAANSSCDIATGQCFCKPGVTGLNCNKCEQYHYGFSSYGCEACNCDELGSTSLQCDDNGQCPCVDNVEGQQCQSCKENKYDKKRGCVDCPACYTLVKNVVHSHTLNLVNLTSLLSNLVKSPTIIDNVEFDEKLKSIQDAVQQLSQDALRAAGGYNHELTSRLNELREKIQNFNKSLEKINKDSDEMETVFKDTEDSMKTIHNIISKAKNETKEALNFVLTDGALALSKAKNRSAEFGQQNQQMTEIAQKARENVNKQYAEVEETQKIAEKAANISKRAYELTTEAREKKKNASDELVKLEAEHHRLKGLLDKMLPEANLTQIRTSAAYEEASSLYFESFSTMNLSTVNLEEINKKAMDQEELAKQYLNEVERLESLLDTERMVIEDDIAMAEEDLKLGTDLQEKMNELLADVHTAEKMATDAATIGNKTLKDAEETYRTLQDFDEKFQESKAKARVALDTIPEIKIMLKEAKEKTANANEALAHAETNVKLASTTATDALDKFAEQASSEAAQILKTSEEMQEKAISLKKETDALGNRVTDTQKKLQEMKNQANRETMNVKDAILLVGTADNNTEEALKQVTNALKEIEDIMKNLSDSPDIDEESLRQLEELINQVENEGMDSDLDKKIQDLENAKSEQALQVKGYEEELVKLKAEVENVRLISEALPTEGCYKRTRLEP